MNKAFIKLAYRHIIDINSKEKFERDVFDDSYSEFKMQSQGYNPEGRLNTFSELVAANPKANSLHYKTGFAVGLYIRALNNKIPGLFDIHERVQMPFSNYAFNIASSHIQDKTLHKVSITYTTPVFTMYAIIGDKLLLSQGEALATSEEAETFLLATSFNLSICSYKEILSSITVHQL